MHKLDFTTLLFSQLRPVDAAMLFARASVRLSDAIRGAKHHSKK